MNLAKGHKNTSKDDLKTVTLSFQGQQRSNFLISDPNFVPMPPVTPCRGQNPAQGQRGLALMILSSGGSEEAASSDWSRLIKVSSGHHAGGMSYLDTSD